MKFSDDVNICTGVLISIDYVLVPNHCLDGARRAHMVFAFNDLNANEDSQYTMDSDQFITNQNFRRDSLFNDFALIQLPTQIVPSKNGIQVAELPAFSDVDLSLGSTINCLSMDKLSDSSSSITGGIGLEQMTILSNNEAENYYGANLLSPQKIAFDTSSGKNPGSLSACFVPNLNGGNTIWALGSFRSSNGLEDRNPVVMTRMNDHEVLNFIQSNTSITINP